MRTLAILGAISVLVLASAPDALALPKKASWMHASGHVATGRSALQKVSALLLKSAVQQRHATRPHRAAAPTALLSSLEADIVSRINAQ